jgi:NADH-quinone oxidoreductase subunit M
VKDRRTPTICGRSAGRCPRSSRGSALLTFACLASLGLPGLAGFWERMPVPFGAHSPAAVLPRTTYLVFMVIAGLGTVLTAAYFLQLVTTSAGVTRPRTRRPRSLSISVASS